MRTLAFCAIYLLLLQDPLTGTWTGDWGPSKADRNDVTVQLRFDGKVLRGTVNPGKDQVALEKTSFDPQTGVVHMEAITQSASGRVLHYIIEGKLSDNTISGSWNHDNIKGDFKITKK